MGKFYAKVWNWGGILSGEPVWVKLSPCVGYIRENFMLLDQPLIIFHMKYGDLDGVNPVN